jgi:hypothetical protein
MKYGFALRRLALTGPGKPAAELRFARGLNVIAGPSDTGKSFVLECIDYALGAGDAPEAIPEAEGYTLVSLEIEANAADQHRYTIERSLLGGDIVLKTEGAQDRTLGAKHQAGNTDTVSRFLLDLSGLGGRKLRRNVQGVTHELSFRKVAPLVLIDEDTVHSKKRSPIWTGQRDDKTTESGTFRLLLTGVDDSSVVAKQDPKIARGRQQGKAEAIDDLLQKAREDLADLNGVTSLDAERARLARLETALHAASAERDKEQTHASPLEARRRAAWNGLRMAESKLNVLIELQKRFDLLQQQYESDLRRLEAISEAGARLDQLSEKTRCPTCGAILEHHDTVHRGEPLVPAGLSQACRAEAAKTSSLLEDLQKTRASTTADIEKLSGERDERQTEFDSAAGELREVLEKRVGIASKKVDEIRGRRDACQKAIDVLERIRSFESLLAEAKAPVKRERAEGPALLVSTAQAEPFSKAVESLLKAWHFPNLDRVTFDEKRQDVVISGRARTSHGKGVRAITRAAFNLALLRHCVDDERPFPNFVLIDSPLLVYEKPDPGELEFPQDVKRYFWESVKSSFTDAQVIILENRRQVPDVGIATANVVLFTGNDQGRRGFIPTHGGTT